MGRWVFAAFPGWDDRRDPRSELRQLRNPNEHATPGDIDRRPARLQVGKTKLQNNIAGACLLWLPAGLAIAASVVYLRPDTDRRKIIP